MARRKSSLVRALLLTPFAAQSPRGWHASVGAQGAPEERCTCRRRSGPDRSARLPHSRQVTPKKTTKKKPGELSCARCTPCRPHLGGARLRIVHPNTVLLVSGHCRHCCPPHPPLCPSSCWRRRRSSRNPRRGCRQDAEAVPIPPRHARPEGDPQVPEKHRPAGPQAALRPPGASHVSALAAATRLRRSAGWVCAWWGHGLEVSLTLCGRRTQVREIANNLTPEPFRWTAEALLALQEVRVLLLAVRDEWTLTSAVLSVCAVHGGLHGAPVRGLQPVRHPRQARHNQCVFSGLSRGPSWVYR
jgi:hypothetical protein